MCGNVKCFRLEPQDKKRQQKRLRFLSMMLGNFFPITIIFFYVYDFTDIDECKGNHSCHVNATCKNILGSHVRQCQAGYTGNGRNCSLRYNIKNSPRSTTVPHHSAALQDN